MRLEHYPSVQLAADIRRIAGRHLDLTKYRVFFFFGSRVAGTGDDRSDVDVGIDGPEPVSLAAIGAIQEDVEAIPTLYTIEVVDFAVVSTGFRRVALEHTESISEPMRGARPRGQ